MPIRPRRRPPRPGALLDLSPIRIARQIILLQVLYYICAIVLLVFTALVAGRPLSMDLLLDWRGVRGDTTEGWMLGIVWLLNGFLSTIPIALFIARSKFVTDFALTMHFLHLLAVTGYTRSLPTTVFWWAVQGASSALVISLGRWICQWRELQPISFGGSGGAAGSTAQRQGAAGPGGNGNGHDGGKETEDVEMGRSYGRGPGRKGRDGMGVYEMAQMKDRHENG